jgi:hypothetical protein
MHLSQKRFLLVNSSSVSQSPREDRFWRDKMEALDQILVLRGLRVREGNKKFFDVYTALCIIEKDDSLFSVVCERRK